MSKKSTDTVRVAEIETLPIDLCKLLKFENMVQSGGEAKFMIGEGLVSVNGIVETRKSKKIFSGDIISFADEQIKIVQNDQRMNNNQE